MKGKIFAGALGGVVGLAHIGFMATYLSKDKLPSFDLPVGPYTSYVIQADKEQYKISYRSDDPAKFYITTDIKKKSGFLGLGNDKTQIVEEVTSTSIDRGLQSKESSPQLSDEQIACIKAEGSGENTGRLVGSSVGASIAPQVSQIPIIGWVAAGWVTMFGGNKGADVGGTMSKSMNGC
tara:strand:- start:450 stop:986 length:537 start_codon:yes stop_codon:yes gene_type:complete